MEGRPPNLFAVGSQALEVRKENPNARKAGIDDGLMMEIVAHVAANTLTNYANELAGSEIDFPVVEVKL